MPVYKLRNGLSIDFTFNTPTLFSPRPAEFDFQPGNLYGSSLDAYPFPIDEEGHPIPHTNLIKMSVSGTLKGASADLFAKCSLRFIQLIRVGSFRLEYYGKRNDEGYVEWHWTNRLLQRNIDCWVAKDASRDSSPFQWPYPERSEHLPPDKLTATLGDTPGASVPLAEFNKKSKCDNYLRTFSDRRSFESIAVFVHPDNSYEMLESWKWGFIRSVVVKWAKLRPEFDGTNSITFSKGAASASVFGKDDEYSDTLLSGRVANRLTNDAMQNFRSSPDTSYNSIADPDFLWPASFWAP